LSFKIASLHMHKQHEQAFALFEQWLPKAKAELGPDEPTTFSLISNMADTFLGTGMEAKIIPVFEDCLLKQRAILGDLHPDTLLTMDRLGVAFLWIGESKKAVPLFDECVKHRGVGRAEFSPLTQLTRIKLARACREANDLKRAVALSEETLARSKAKFGLEDERTQDAAMELAEAYGAAQRFQEAVPMLEARRVWLRAQGREKGNEYATALGRLHLYYSCLNNIAKADEMARGVIEWVRTNRMSEKEYLAGWLEWLGLSLLKASAFAEAELHIRECLNIREKTQPDSWSTFNTQSSLGGALLGRKKYADAEPLLLKGYEGMKAREKTIPPPDNTHIPEALDRLIDLYTAMNKRDEVRKWRTERAKYPNIAPMPREKK
jgi:eukaryotic-like serine/threonine-protein kinase